MPLGQPKNHRIKQGNYDLTQTVVWHNINSVHNVHNVSYTAADQATAGHSVKPFHEIHHAPCRALLMRQTQPSQAEQPMSRTHLPPSLRPAFPRAYTLPNTLTARGSDGKPLLVILRIQRMENRLPRRARVSTSGYSDLTRLASPGVIVVKVNHSADARASCFCIAALSTPGKKPVELPQCPCAFCYCIAVLSTPSKRPVELSQLLSTSTLCIAVVSTPGKRPVELPQYPRPPPSGISLRAQKEPVEF